MSEAKDQREPSMEEILASIRRIIAEDGETAPAPAEPRHTPPAREEDILELTEVVEADGTVVSLTPGGARKPAAAAQDSAPGPEPEREPEPPAPVVAEPEPPLPLARQPEPFRPEPPLVTPRVEPPPPRIEPAPEPAAQPSATLPPATPRPAEPAPSPDRLVSSATAAASVAALSQLADLGQRGEVATQPLGDAGRTLEGLVRELLRPMLRDWLDANQPQLVDLLRPALKAWLDANLAPLVERLVREEIQRMSRDAQVR